MKINHNPIAETVYSRVGNLLEDMDFEEAAKIIRETRRQIIKDNTSRYSEYLNSDLWNSKRKLVLKRASYSCEGCGSTNKPLDIHHLTYDRVGNELLTDLVAYCRGCHDLAHGNVDELSDLSWSKYLDFSTDTKPKNISEMSKEEIYAQMIKDI